MSHKYAKVKGEADEEMGLSERPSTPKRARGKKDKDQLMSVVVIPGGAGQAYSGKSHRTIKKGRSPFKMQQLRDEDDDDDDEDDNRQPSWARIGSYAIWVAYASLVLGVVYICEGIISVDWREALDEFVTAFALWLVACFLFRFRAAIVAMTGDQDFEQGMELHDIFHILKTLSILYLMRYMLVFVLFIVGLFGYIEKKSAASGSSGSSGGSG